MGKDPYAQGLISFNPFVERRKVKGELVTVLDGRLADRGIELIHPRSRVLQKNEIHELILTVEKDAKPASQVNRICYLGFFEVHQGGVIVSGDQVVIGQKWFGEIVGYDETHVPNHINIVVTADEENTGFEIGLRVGETIEIIPKESQNIKG